MSIGQGDAAIVPFVDAALYVMTAEYGAASQLEKIDMFDYADVIAINKFDRKGAEDAMRDVQTQYQRNHLRFDDPADSMPVYGTIAAKFNDDGVTSLFHGILEALHEKTGAAWLREASTPKPLSKKSSSKKKLDPTPTLFD